MSQIKYYIFVFLVFFTTCIYPQNNTDGDIAMKKNKIEVFIKNATQETQKSNFHSALNILEKALIVSEDIKDEKEQAIILSKIAQVHYNIENYDEALPNIIKALAIQRRIGDKVNLAISRYTCGLIYLKQQNYIKSIDYFKSSKAIFEEEGLNTLTAEVILSEAKTHIGLDDLSQANALVDKAIILSKKHKIVAIESAALIQSGIIALKQVKYEKALSQTLKASELAKNNELARLLSESYQLLSNIYEITGNFQLANSNLKLYINLNDSILEEKIEHLSPEEKDSLIPDDNGEVASNQDEKDKEDSESDGLGRLTTILSVGLITILSLLTLSLYKNNNIRLKTNNMLYRKNEELLTEKERAEIAAKTKTNFLSTVTHELRTPLYAVTGLTNMLLEENPRPEQIQHLKSLKFSGDYLLTFINDILQINKIEANKVELDPEIFNLKNKVENVIAALNNSALDNNTQIHFEYDKKLPEIFDGDQLKISQILINLIGNSIKFTKDGDIWVRVTQMSLAKKMHSIRLEVEDNGIGITKEKQDSMFESFSQGSVQINRKYGGTGLGLSIVKGLIEILKGKIYLKSELGQGTSFFVEFPLQASKAVATIKKKDYSKDIKNLDLDSIKILVVEDNKINQMITKKILNKMGLTCDLVDNGEDAVEQVKDIEYNLVLMDIHMPGISGLEATKRIRSFNKELTIFALTAVTLEDKMPEFDAAGFNDIISKPFKQEDFEKKLYEALSDTNETVASA